MPQTSNTWSLFPAAGPFSDKSPKESGPEPGKKKCVIIADRHQGDTNGASIFQLAATA